MRALVRLVVLVAGFGGCATMERHQLATGTTVGTVVVSPATFAAAYYLLNRPWGCPICKPCEERPKPAPREWGDLDAADAAARRVVP